MIKKTFSAIAGILFLAGMACAAEKPGVVFVEPAAGGVRMIDFSPRLIDKDFKFRYPASWYVREEFILAHHGVIFTSEKMDEKKLPAVAVFVYRDIGFFKSGGNLPAETWEGFKKKLSEMKKEGTGISVSSVQETAINDMPVCRIDYVDPTNVVSSINVKSGDDLYSVVAVCKKELFPLYRVMLEDVMTSLEIPAGKNKWTGIKELSKAEFSDPRAVVEAAQGRNVVIVMRSNPTTGYSWAIAKEVDKKKLVPIKKGYIPAATALVGAGGKDVFVFKAVGKGEATVSLKYARAWEKEQPPEEAAEFRIIIK